MNIPCYHSALFAVSCLVPFRVQERPMILWMLFSSAICSPDVAFQWVMGWGLSFGSDLSMDCVPDTPFPSSNSPTPDSPREGSFVVCVLFPIPNSNQALICSCSPVEIFLWVWVRRRKRNAHAAWGSFPSIKVTSHMHSEGVVLANSFHPTVNSWGNIYTSETLLNFLFNQCLKSYHFCLLLKFTTKLKYISFCVTHAWFCLGSWDSLHQDYWLLVISEKKTYPAEISEFNVPVFSNEFFQGRQISEQ